MTKKKITERTAADANYRGLPGFPAMDTLVDQESFVPDDPEENLSKKDYLGPTLGGREIDPELAETKLSTVIKPKDSKMKDKLSKLIESLVEAEAIGSEPMLNTMNGILQTIIAKYGGDYEKAKTSPEWQTAISNGDQALTASKTAKPAIVRPFETPGVVQKPTLASLKPASPQTIAQQQQAAKDAQLTRAKSVADRVRQQRPSGPTGTSGTNPPPAPGTGLSGQQGLKNTLESKLREMVRDVITEELMEDALGADFDQWLGGNPPSPEEQIFARAEDMPVPLGEPEELDPEVNMDPQNRENMINSLLDLEFQESAKKSIPVNSLKEMIRESVKRHIKGKS